MPKEANAQPRDERPKSGASGMTEAERIAHELNRPLREKLEALEPRQETSFGDRFLADAEDYAAVSGRVKSLQKELQELHDRVPPGTDTDEVERKLAQEIKGQMERMEQISAAYGEDDWLFKADVDSLMEIREKIDTKRAQLKKVALSDMGKKPYLGLSGDIADRTAQLKEKAITELQRKYDDYAAMLKRSYDRPDGSGQDQSIDTASKEEFEKDIDAMLAKLDSSPAEPEEIEVTEDMLSFPAASDESAESNRRFAQILRETKAGPQELLARRITFLETQKQKALDTLKSLGFADENAVDTALVKRAKGGFFAKLLGGFTEKGRALDAYEKNLSQLNEANEKLHDAKRAGK